MDPVRVRERRRLPHFVRAATYSFGGFRRLVREKAFREEAIGLLVILALFASVKADAGAYLVQLILFLLLASFEALNTAIEMLVDRVSPDCSRFAEQAKDLGSFAVFCLLCANAGYAFAVLIGFAI